MEQKPSIARPCLRPHGYYAKRPDSIAKIRDCPNGYPLPQGLNPGDVVRIMAFDHGYYTVEKDGRSFDIFIVNMVQ
jgi:hypothetical protein